MEIHDSLANLYRYVQLLRKGELKESNSSELMSDLICCLILMSYSLVLSFQKSDHGDCYQQSVETV